MSRLVAGTLPLAGLMTRVAEFAVGAIPGADGAGITLVEHGRADTIVASAAFVAEVDEIQYRLGEGPSIGRVHSVVSRRGLASVRASDDWGCTAPCRCRYF